MSLIDISIFASKRVLQMLFYWDFLDFNEAAQLPFPRINSFHDTNQSLIA